MDFSPKKELLRFLAEDVGKADITSSLLPRKKIKARIISRQDGVIAGVKYVKEIFVLKGCRVKIIKKDGCRIKSISNIKYFLHSLISFLVGILLLGGLHLTTLVIYIVDLFIPL